MFGFEDFMRARGGGGGGRPANVDTTKYYKLLGVPKDATSSQIRKAYFKLARTHHPDKGGDEEKFKEIQTAKEVLMDPAKREIYDKYGEKGLESGGSPDPTSIFDLFGGGGPGRRGPRGPSKPKPIVCKLDLRLVDVFSGPSKPVTYQFLTATRRVECTTCDGAGVVMQKMRMGPGMIMQRQMACPSCKGKGLTFEDEKKEKVTKRVAIPKGVCNGDKIRLEGEGHRLPGAPRGDVVVVCSVFKHRMFERKGADLAMRKQVSLREALGGFSFNVRHVSGTTLVVRSAPGEMVRPGQVKRLDGWGLPQKGGYDTKGHLYIKFDVLFPVPASLGEGEAKELSSVLGSVAFPKSEAALSKIAYSGASAKPTFAKGARVRLCNLRSAGFNGKEGVLIKDAKDLSGKWAVHLDMGRKVGVPEQCLELVKAAPAAPADAKAKDAKKKEDKEGEDEDDDEDEYDYEENVTLEDVEGNPTVTPAAADTGAYDEDEDEERQTECRQM